MAMRSVILDSNSPILGIDYLKKTDDSGTSMLDDLRLHKYPYLEIIGGDGYDQEGLLIYSSLLGCSLLFCFCHVNSFHPCFHICC